MKNYLLLLLTLSTLVLVSCKDDEPEIDPIVGLWELDEITLSDPPSGYLIATNLKINSTLWYEDKYEIEFFEDGTYERFLTNASTINGEFDIEDEGEWEIDGDELDLDQEDGDTDELVFSFTIDGEITERSMTLIGEDLWLVWPPSVVNDPNQPLDTLEQSELADFFAEYGDIIEVTFTMEFDRQ